VTTNLSGEIAFVTGAASGIGAACARLLAEAGARICCTDLDGEGAAARAAEIGEDAIGLALDVTDEAGWHAAIRSTKQQLGPPSILVHAAGISAATPIAESSLADWRGVLAVNLDGAFLATSHGVRAMREGGGSIVLIGSASGVKPAAGAVAYSVSKAGVTMLARTAAKEGRDAGLSIRINVVSPAGVKTPLWPVRPSPSRRTWRGWCATWHHRRRG